MKHTEIDLNRTKRELRHALDLWPGADLISIGDYRDQANQDAAIVVFDFNGNRVRIEYDRACHHRCNLRAVCLTLDAIRLSYYRGLGDALMHTVQQMLALPGAQYVDPYELLGVRPDAPMEDIEDMFKIKAKRAHPDRGGTVEAMAQLNAAIERIRADRADQESREASN